MASRSSQQSEKDFEEEDCADYITKKIYNPPTGRREIKDEVDANECAKSQSSVNKLNSDLDDDSEVDNQDDDSEVDTADCLTRIIRNPSDRKGDDEVYKRTDAGHQESNYQTESHSDDSPKVAVADCFAKIPGEGGNGEVSGRNNKDDPNKDDPKSNHQMKSQSPRRKPDFEYDETDDPPKNNDVNDSFINQFLEACSDGDIDKLKNQIIPKIKNSNIDVCTLTNDVYCSATGLHLALLNDHSNTVDLLVHEFGKTLILQPYTNEQNSGLTALHLAITKNMVPQLKKMMASLSDMEKEDLIHAECSGSFFKKKWHVTSVPLSVALLQKNLEIAEILLREGADCRYNSVENDGDTIIHSIAKHSMRYPEDAQSQLEMLQQVLNNTLGKQAGCVQMRNLIQDTNDAGLSPLLYSLNIGAAAVTRSILELRWVYKVPQWNYNPMQFNIYDVTHLKKKQNLWRISGLELLAFNTDPSILEVYKEEPVRTLVDAVWKKYSLVHVASGLLHLVYMILFTVGVMSKHILGRPVKSAAEEEPWVTAICVILALWSLVWTIVPLVDTVYYLSPLYTFRMMERGRRRKYTSLSKKQSNKVDAEHDQTDGARRTTKNQDYENSIELKSYQPSQRERHAQRQSFSAIPIKFLLRFNTFKAIYFSLDFLIFLWSVLRLAGSENEAPVAVFPLLLGWYSCIYYTIFFENIFLFMLMLNNMLMSNIVHFMVALVFIMLGFSTAFKNLQDPTRTTPEEMYKFGQVLNTLFRQMIALNDIDEHMEEMKFSTWSRVVMIIFFVIATILLLNTLLASMTDTYTNVRDNKIALWYRVKLQIALQAERPTFWGLKCLQRNSEQLETKDGKCYLEVHVIGHNN